MTTPIAISFVETDLDALAAAEGKLAVIVTPALDENTIYIRTEKQLIAFRAQ